MDSRTTPPPDISNRSTTFQIEIARGARVSTEVQSGRNTGASTAVNAAAAREVRLALLLPPLVMTVCDK
jgi:hypothetical protein